MSAYDPDKASHRASDVRVASYNLIRDERGYWLVWGIKTDQGFTGPAAPIPIEHDPIPMGACVPVDLIRTDLLGGGDQ